MEFKDVLYVFKERIGSFCKNIWKEEGFIAYKVHMLPEDVEKIIDDIWPLDLKRPHVDYFERLGDTIIFIENSEVNQLKLDDYYIFDGRYKDDIPLGLDASKVVTSRSNISHLIVGTVGTGKTYLIKKMLDRITKLKDIETEFYICDPKISEFISYKNDPRFQNIVTDPKEILEVVRNLKEECLKRLKICEKKDTYATKEHRIYLVISELADFEDSIKDEILSCFKNTILPFEQMETVAFRTLNIKENEFASRYVLRNNDAGELDYRGHAIINHSTKAHWFQDGEFVLNVEIFKVE